MKRCAKVRTVSFVLILSIIFSLFCAPTSVEAKALYLRETIMLVK